jgi:hypothetical protein
MATTPATEICKKLNVKAKDNHGYQYDVELVLRESKYWGYKWVLVIKGTPGSWYMTTLLYTDYGPQRGMIYIDFGQRWCCTNFDEVFSEAKRNI